MKIKKMMQTLQKCNLKYKEVRQKAILTHEGDAATQRKFINRYLTKLPSHGSFQSLMEQVNDLTLEDLGIDGENDPYFFRPEQDHKGRNYPPLSATHIEEKEDYAVLLFFLKKGSVMPLHDHQDMILFTRVLTGSLRYRSMDKINHEDFEVDPLSVFMYY
jgi:hypothetical protein